MEKILLYFDQANADYLITNIETSAVERIKQKLIPEWENLGMGDITTEYFSDLLSGGSYVKEQCKKNIESRLTKAGIPKRSIDTMLEDANEDFENVMREVQALINIYTRNHLLLLVFTKGKPTLSEESKEVIREENKMYVKTEKGKQLKTLHEKATIAINELYKALENSKGHYLPLPGLFELSEAGGKFIPAKSDYDYLVSQ